MRKIKYSTLFMIISPLIILMIVCLFLAYQGISNLPITSTGTKKDTHYIEKMDYSLRDNATELQKTYFAELIEAIDSDDASQLEMALENGYTADHYIASLVVKNYVADLYTWSNKMGSYDVGGNCYVYSRNRVIAYAEVKDKFYYNVSEYIDEYGQENLLEVTNVNVLEVQDGSEKEINGEMHDTIRVYAEWEYKDNEGAKIADFEKIGYFLIYINDDGRFEIVESYGNR